MAGLSDTLKHPIDWRDTALWPFLDELQGNILKGHGRDHTLNHFIRFDSARIHDVKAQLRVVATQVTSALRQLHEADARRQFGRDGGTAVFFFLTAAGYRKLGLSAPHGHAFADGMARRTLADPAPQNWEAHLAPGIDALLIVADDSPTKVGNAAAGLTRDFAAHGLRIVGVDAGHALRSEPSPNDAKGRGIEHFGYVDGRSQPLLLVEDVQREITENGGIDHWDPRFGPSALALVPDPHGTTRHSFGSFLVYRKLEQNVKGFKAHEDALADALGLTGEDKERAGAMVVGRFEDGTPLILSDEATDPTPTPNNFTYAGDPRGLKCPFHAHVRKVNPRDNSAEQRSHLMPRRGIPFGDPDRDLEDEASFPTGGVGLLFMCYNRSIEDQFEVAQQHWANSVTFPGQATGIDPVIGQGASSPAGSAPPQPKWHPHYGQAGGEVAFGFHGFVTMKGGEYFFAPSIGFLKGLD